MPVGVTVRKKIIPIMIGETIAPKSKPNLCQSLFGKTKILVKKIEKNKKIKEIISAHM